MVKELPPYMLYKYANGDLSRVVTNHKTILRISKRGFTHYRRPGRKSASKFKYMGFSENLAVLKEVTT